MSNQTESSKSADATPYQLRLWGWPAREKNAFLKTRQIAPQVLPTPLKRDLELLRQGDAGSSRHLRSLWLRAAGLGVLSRLALLAAVTVSTRVFSPNTTYGLALTISAGYLLFQLIGAVAQYLADVTRGQLMFSIEVFLTTRVNRKLIALDPEQGQEFSMGNLKNLVTSDIPTIAEFASAIAWNLVPALASVVILGPAVYFMAGLPGLIGIVMAFLNVPFAVLISRTLERQSSKRQIHLDSISTLVSEWLRNVRLSRFLGWQTSFRRDIDGALKRYMLVFIKRHALLCVTFGISFAWWMIPVAAILISGQLLGKPLDLKGFFATLWIIKDLSEYLQHLPHAINLYSSTKAGMKRIAKLEQAPELARHLTQDGPTPAADAVPIRLDLEDVAIGYQDHVIVKGLKLSLDMTKRTAIIGGVAAGKTTLLRLLSGDLAPHSGHIHVTFSDGTSGSLWQKPLYEAYRGALAYVPQEPFISNATMATNIALDAQLATPEHLKAAHHAELDVDLAAMPLGLAEMLGETGVNLSGGQKQRISLARALYAKRPFMLLDDPLSAVDTKTEAALMNHLMGASRGFILVSHRLDELKRVDRLITMNDGLILEDDTPEVLLARADSHFRRFLAASETGGMHE